MTQAMLEEREQALAQAVADAVQAGTLQKDSEIEMRRAFANTRL